LKLEITLTAILMLLATYLAAPTFSFTPAIHGKPCFSDFPFIIHYVNCWWTKTFRTMQGRYGLAEQAVINMAHASNYKFPSTKTVGEVDTIHEVIAALKQHDCSNIYLQFLQANHLPNKTAQINLLIVPEQIYVTLVWDGRQLKVYDGWQEDLGCHEYIIATASSSLITQLYRNRINMNNIRHLLLDAEANGDLAYKVIRANPATAEAILALQIVATLIDILLSSLMIRHLLRKGV